MARNIEKLSEEKLPISGEILKRARRVLLSPQVTGPFRAPSSVAFVKEARGSRFVDFDGNEYVDYVGTWGPAIVGHADDRVLDAIKETMDKGTSFGAPCALENELAKVRKRCDDPREVTPRAALPFVRTLARRCSSNA